MEQKPSICRIVQFRESPADKLEPAVIREVNEDGTVQLHVFASGVNHQNVKQGDNINEWNWPPRV